MTIRRRLVLILLLPALSLGGYLARPSPSVSLPASPLSAGLPLFSVVAAGLRP